MNKIEIRTAKELQKIGKDEAYPLDGNYILMNDIDCSEIDDFEPIKAFYGIFNGQDYEIQNLRINNGGLVEENGGTIKNLHLKDVEIKGNNYVGGLVGYNIGGTIKNSYVAGNILGEYYVGGLVGHNKGGTIINSQTTGDVEGKESVGGLVGENNWNGKIVNSYTTGNINGNRYVGGLVGWNWKELIESYAKENNE